MAARRPLGFDIVGLRSSQSQVSTARFTCSKCRESVHITIKNALNPEALAKDAARLGWEADAFVASRNRCPRCQRKAANTINDTSSELKKLEAKMAQQPPPLPPKTEVPLRDPTGNQRNTIRSLLDRNFDTDDGCWLNGYSDQKAAEEVGVARIVVERIRDAAYGPVRITPEMLEIRSQLDALRDAIGRIDSAAASLSEQLQADVVALRKQLTAIEAKFNTVAKVA